MPRVHVKLFGALLLLLIASPSIGSEPFMGAYIGLPRLLKDKPDQAARERAIVDLADHFQQSGLNVMMPFRAVALKTALYPSRIIVDKSFGDWDPLDLIVREGRRRSLQVYPVIAVLRDGDKESGSVLELHPDWATRDKNGNPLGFISPGHPEARKWVISVIHEIAAKYQPEGIVLDYLRYSGEGAMMDPVSQAQFDESHPAELFPRDSGKYRQAFLQFKRDKLTELVGQISADLRALNPKLRIAMYVWNSRELQGTRDWAAWARRGYLDMLNLSGYYYPDNRGEKYLQVMEEEFRTVGKILKETGKPVEFTVCVGIVTSHGKIPSAKNIQDYLQIAKRCGVHGAAFFTWNTLEPYLPEVKKAGYLDEFLTGLPPKPE